MPLLLSALAACVAACGGGAGGEGGARVVNVYNWADYIGSTTIADFEAEYGIKVNYDQYDSSETVEAKLMTGSTGYDVVVHGGQYSSRLIPVGIYKQLERGRLTNWKELDPEVLEMLAKYDPGNRYAAPYMWGSTGFAYNIDMIRERMPDAPVDSGDMLFKPEVVSKFADCGVSFLDSPTDVIPMVLAYLGYDGNSTDPAEVEAAEKVLKSVRPYIKYFSNTKMLNDLPNRDICLVMSWSGEYATARARAAEAGIDINLAYSVPKEGSVSWFDALFIPSDAPHVDNAYLFIDFLLRADVIAKITNLTRYANANLVANDLVHPDIINDPAIYTPPDVLAVLQINRALPPKEERVRTRTWSRVKTGM